MNNIHGTIVALHIATTHRAPMEHPQVARAIADLGLEGDIHNKPGGKRQVLLMDEETLNAFGLQAGQVRENVTTRGIELKTLAPGTRLRAGGAVFEIAQPCDPCKMIDDIRPGLRAQMQGQRGMFVRVVEGGDVRVGNAIEIANE
ncbi:MAG: MOSC domain-containing protein [Anaerolineales bacterium]|nr:MOSC domain-containing protein [Anaerolineales bacterium]